MYFDFVAVVVICVWCLWVSLVWLVVWCWLDVGGLVAVAFWRIVLLFVAVCVLLFMLWWSTAASWFGLIVGLCLRLCCLGVVDVWVFLRVVVIVFSALCCDKLLLVVV